MINSLLNATGVSSLLLTIVIILAVVVAGALIVYLLWEVVVSASKKNKNGASRELRFDDEKPVKQANSMLVADYELDKAEEQETIVVESEKVSDIDVVKAEEEQAQFEEEKAAQERENDERRAYLEARRQELLRRMQVEAEEETEDVEEEPAVVEFVEETVSETIEEPAEEEVAPVAIAEMETVEENNNEELLEEQRRALEEEKERYATMVRELEEAKKILQEQTRAQKEATAIAVAAAQAEPVVETVVTNVSALSLEEIKEKLALAEERLKATEKEFKQCKKEYIPLKRVWNTYEKDQKKLRRKEALVAKQKVLLYGVNNYADIDPDKANKLAEDLDLLDGLKLSVQHCQEVMKNNEERYPLLEKMYNVLKLRNDELKKDIAIYRQEIARIESEEDQSSETETIE